MIDSLTSNANPAPETEAGWIEAVGRDICLRGRVYPLGLEGGILRFAALNPWDELLRETLQLRAEWPVELLPSDPKLLEAQLSALAGSANGMAGGAILSELIKSEVTL